MVISLFIYCDRKDESIREGCYEDYILYECGNIIFSDQGDIMVGEGLSGKDIKLVNDYIVVICNVDEDNNCEMSVKEIIDDKDNVLEYLLR